jgi:membrane protein implicated in regulation of membrane protease activity
VRWLVFFLLMGLSWQGVKLLPWPSWTQIIVLLIVNLILGALIWPSEQDEAKRPEGEAR